MGGWYCYKPPRKRQVHKKDRLCINCRKRIESSNPVCGECAQYLHYRVEHKK